MVLTSTTQQSAVSSDPRLMQDLFPAVYTTLSPQALIELVLENYPLDCVARCVLWNRGLSDVYLVECEGNPYILRISHHHWRSRSEIEFELRLLDFLHHQDLPVAHPIPTRDSELFVTIPALEGDRYATLFSYAEGSVPLGDLDRPQAEIFGETLARLHQAGNKFDGGKEPKVLNLEYLLDDSYRAIAPFLSHYPDELAFLKRKVTQIGSELEALPTEAPYWGVCWGDPHSGNSHFSEGDRITVFDFDQCGYCWHAFDVAKFLQVSLNAGMSRYIRESFFAGYQSVNPLTSLELDSLQALTQTAHIWNWAISIQGAAIHCWSKLDRPYFRHRVETLKRLNSPNWRIF